MDGASGMASRIINIEVIDDGGKGNQIALKKRKEGSDGIPPQTGQPT